MLSALKFDERFPHSDPYGDMESEIAELRTMTRVTKLRQQIECRQEGAWMSVRDVPDDRSSSGTRKVTTFGRATRSVTRSFTSDVNLGDFLSNGIHKSNGVRPKDEGIVEFPDEFSQTNLKPDNSVEITEVVDNESKSDESEPTYGVPIKTSPMKKTSVVTLGQGNVVLIDPQDSNFKVIGMSKVSKGAAADEPSTKPGDNKKVKKVGFCKTEVHFAPDSGKVNIVETDEKPPSSQVMRRKKKPRKPVQKSSMPKLYFGDLEKEKISGEKSVVNEDLPSSRVEHIFPVIREPSPLLSTSITSQAWSVKENLSTKKVENLGGYGELGRSRTPKLRSEEKSDKTYTGDNIDKSPKNKEFSEWKKEGSFLRNVSPKLSKLISNNMQHEFQQKQMEIMRKSKVQEIEEESKANVVVSKADVDDGDIPVAVNIHVSSDESQMKVKPVKIVAQVRVSLEERKAKAEQDPKTFEEPVYVNEGVTRTINVVREDDKPKPKSSLTKIVLDDAKEKKRTKSSTKTSTLERTGRKSSTPTAQSREVRPKKDFPKREVAVVKPMKPAKGSLPRPEPCRRSRPTSDSLRPFKPLKTQDPLKTRSQLEAAKSKKSKEPLRSFEKVSNGWVGHCVVPVKTAKGGSRVSITTASTSHSAVSSSKTHGVKSETASVDVKTPVAVRVDKFHSRSSLTSAKQFSLSREHLKSAKLVKELYKGADVKSDVPRAKPIVDRDPGDDKGSKSKSIVSRRRLMYEEGRHNIRRDSEQSDDSVIRADEEVRAYMFNSKSKVLHLTIGDGNFTGGRIATDLYSNYELSNPVFSYACRWLWDSQSLIPFVNIFSIKSFYSRETALFCITYPK